MLHMSQKSYIMEIVDALLKSDNHLRGLAKQLNTNQMTISRKIKELYQNNAVDFRQEGKNKVYFLKKSIESEEYVFLSEHYKLLKTIEMYPLLKQVFIKIRGNLKIKLAVLFGSYSKGLAYKDSDIDIYIETASQSLKKQIEQINTKINLKIGKYDKNSLLIKEIEKSHVIIKGVEEYYERNKFFR